jgi:hypothetical protein
MRKKVFTLILALALVMSFVLIKTDFAKAEDELMITVTLTVEGEIQLDDPWTTGETAVNEWAKPMYYIWLDPNGDPEDARYGNGAGPSAHHIRCDTGVLRVEDNTDPANPLIYTTIAGTKQWSNDTLNIEASITNSDKSLQVSFPLSLIGNPTSLDVSAMCSPRTGSAFDNTGEGSGSSEGWIVIADATVEGSYEFLDVADETLTWPSSLSDSDRLPNFNIEKLEVVISTESADEEPDEGDDDTPDEGEDSEETSGFDMMWLILVAIIIICLVVIIVAAIYLVTRRKKK